MEKALTLWLLKTQATPGTPEVALAAGDYIECTKDSAGIEADPQSADIDLAGNGYGHDQAVQGRKLANVGLTFPLREELAGHIPGAVIACQSARFAMTENGGYFELAPSNIIQTDCTVWEYSGNMNTDACLLHKAGNVKFGGKLIFDFSGDCYGKLELTGNGLEVGAPIDASQPTVAKDGSVVSALTSVPTFTLCGETVFRPLNLEIDFGQEVAVSVLPSASTGSGKAHVTNRKMTYTAKLIRDIVATVDPVTKSYAGTLGAMALIYGTGAAIDLSCTSISIRKWSKSEDNGIETIDLEGQILDNSLLLKIKGSST